MAIHYLPNISRRALFAISAVILGFILINIFFLTPPNDFPRGIVITVAEGSSVVETASLFADRRIVRSSRALEYLIRNKTGIVLAGDYIFPQPENIIIIARRVTRGEYGLAPIKLTIPEGVTTFDIMALIARLIPEFDTKTFAALAQPREGYLFPDTYYLQPTWGPERMIKAMEKQFWIATKPLAPLIEKSGRTQEQVVIMASLLEREARTAAARRMIAGILWKRLDAGMPLQVDAAFSYITDKNTFELSRQDLATSSPYNTYRYRGLPIGPIANPGFDALLAALTPIESDYWFYLSDRSSNLHYAVDFVEHKRNRARYLP